MWPYPSCAPGITVLTGPMFAGKTTLLRQHVLHYRLLKKSVVVVKHARDTRSMETKVKAPPLLSLSSTLTPYA